MGASPGRGRGLVPRLVALHFLPEFARESPPHSRDWPGRVPSLEPAERPLGSAEWLPPRGPGRPARRRGCCALQRNPAPASALPGKARPPPPAGQASPSDCHCRGRLAFDFRELIAVGHCRTRRQEYRRGPSLLATCVAHLPGTNTTQYQGLRTDQGPGTDQGPRTKDQGLERPDPP